MKIDREKSPREWERVNNLRNAVRDAFRRITGDLNNMSEFLANSGLPSDSADIDALLRLANRFERMVEQNYDTILGTIRGHIAQEGTPAG